MTSPANQILAHLGLRLKLCLARLCPWLVRSPRDKAFHAYFSRIVSSGMRRPETWSLVHTEWLQTGASTGLATLRLRRSGPGRPVQPGDLLEVRWKNPPELVRRSREILGEPGWTVVRTLGPGSLLRPARSADYDADSLLSEVLDLQHPNAMVRLGPVPGDPEVETGRLGERGHTDVTWRKWIREAPRLGTRLYTMSRVDEVAGAGVEIELLVSTRGAGAPRLGRCSRWLATLEPGACVLGWCLPHPHRLPALAGQAGPGLAVVTGSAVAAVLVALRAGVRLQDVWVLWGVADRSKVADLLEELVCHETQGSLGRLLLAESRPGKASGDGRHVQELLASLGDPLFDLLRRDPWIYVSGHRDMAADVRKLLVEARVSASLAVSTVAGERQIADAAVRMRYIESASG